MGKFWQAQILMPCVQLRESQSLGWTADTQKNLLGYTPDHTIILWETQDTHEKLFGIHTSAQTDPDVQYTGTSASLQKKNVSCQPRKREMARIVQNFRGKNSAPI